MKTQVSVVIICRNEAHIIGRTIAAALRFTDDVVVVDSGSTDGTQAIVEAAGARLLETAWDGYGKNKNKGVAIAKNDWILSVDADEIADETLANEISTLELEDIRTMGNIRFRVFLGNKRIRYGEWSGDAHIRLYNRSHTHWNEAAVHENLVQPPGTRVITLRGHLHHYTSGNIREFALKMVNYAALNAEKYHQQGKKAGWTKLYFAAPFSFLKNYIFRLGFLDGKAGFTVARMNAFYTWLKYVRLDELEHRSTET